MTLHLRPIPTTDAASAPLPHACASLRPARPSRCDRGPVTALRCDSPLPSLARVDPIHFAPTSCATADLMTSP